MGIQWWVDHHPLHRHTHTPLSLCLFAYVCLNKHGSAANSSISPARPLTSRCQSSGPPEAVPNDAPLKQASQENKRPLISN